MIISKLLLPNSSSLKQLESEYDYIDSFQAAFFNQSKNIDPTLIGKLFFASIPNWGERLLALRNRIVGLLGLKTTGDPTRELQNFKCESGEQFGPLKVVDKTNNEVIFGVDDKHLDFSVSLLLEQRKTLTISTTVKFNNWFGQFYFSLVRPFHKLIVKSMLKKMIKELEKV